MKTDNLQEYVKLHRQLTEERARLRDRLRRIEEALGELSPITSQAVQAAASNQGPRPTALRPRKAGSTMSPEGRERIAAAQRERWARQRRLKTASEAGGEKKVGSLPLAKRIGKAARVPHT